MKEINNRDELLAFVTGIDANTIVCPCRTRGYTLEYHADTDEMQIAGLGTANPVKVGMTAQKTLVESIEFSCAAAGKMTAPHFCEVFNKIASYVPQRKRNAIIRHYETPTPELIGIPSSLYNYLPMQTLLANVEAALDDTVASYRFVRATYDPWLTALYYDMELEDEHRQNLKEQYDFDGEPVRFSLTITTSDSGLACTSIHPILHVGSREIWLHGKGDSVSHIFNTHATPESKIRASAESIFAIARVGADQLSALFSIAVTHPAEVAYRIMKQLQIATKWTAMCTQSIYGRMQQGMDFTAADLVLEVSDYLEAYLSQNDVAEFRKLNFREDLCKMMFYDRDKWRSMDRDFTEREANVLTLNY